MDLVILVVLLLIVVFFFKSFDSFVYFMALVDIFLRILSFITVEFGTYIPEVANWIKTYIPSSIKAIIDSYSTDIFNTILTIGYVVIFILFEYYVIKYFFKKRRR